MRTNSLPTFLTELLPPLQPCEHLSLEGGEVLVDAPGFEDRTMAVAETVLPSHGTFGILLDYLPLDGRNRLRDVRKVLSKSGVVISHEDVLQYNRFDPADFEKRLRARLLVRRARSVIINVSTMSKLAIILVLNVCYSLNVRVRIVYSEAEIYGPSEDEFKAARDKNEIHRPTLQVFTGVHGVVRVESLASVAMQGQPTAAIIFMSLNDALTQVLLNTVCPSRLFLINGRPPVHSWREEATAWIHDQVRREWEDDNPVWQAIGSSAQIPKRMTSTLDYRETVSLLLHLYWELSASHRMLLAPAGSKFQAIGCYLTKALHPDIHIEYPSPEGFLPYYSSGFGPRWLLDLGILSNLVSEITCAERREYLEIPT